LKRKVVLVVEDNADELMIYTTLLSHRGYAVLAAASYEAGFRIATQQKPDAAVIDVHLGDPQRTGCDLIAALRRAPAAAELRIIAHTAYGDLYNAALQRAGCNEVLHKPSSPVVLLGAIERLIGPAQA
jgi:CheY-like chemotaxis protein